MAGAGHTMRTLCKAARIPVDTACAASRPVSRMFTSATSATKHSDRSLYFDRGASGSAFAPSLFAPRSGTTSLRNVAFQGLRPQPVQRAICSQKRTLYNGATSQNLLAHLEQTANNNPRSATAQNAFYSALLRAGMPEILVERYQTGRYGTNSACDQLYLRALERVGMAESGGSLGLGASTSQSGMANPTSMSNEQFTAVGQALAARHQGANISVASGKPGSGQKRDPLYVVVDETIGNTIFKWVRWLLTFGVLTYFGFVAITLVLELMGRGRMPGAANHAEAKPEMQKTRFSDVHGCDEAKEELQELVEFLKNPKLFSTLGGKLPKGVLLTGPPGTGKTLLARAVAGEAGVPFFYMSGSEFDEVFVGVGAKRVRELFNAARTKSPAIIFIDELDAVGGKRNERDASYSKQTLNQLLTELDGFEQDTGVIIIGATNLPQSLDKALVRPGRFDRTVAVSLPDVRGRMAILKHHMRNIRFDPDVDPAVIARGTPGFSGAELENVVNQAAVHASKNKSKKVSLNDMEWAKDKILMGAEKRSMVIQQKDKIMTAFHEGGHALMAILSTDADPLYKATIMPRGHALGITFQLPEMDKVSVSKKELQDKLDVLMGGKVAEELVYGEDKVTTGCSSDIQQATRIAYSMITEAGMSPTLGNVDFSSQYGKLSSETKRTIESEVRRLVDESYARAKKALSENRAQLDALANALVEYETLTKAEMEAVVRGETLDGKMKASPSAPVLVVSAPEAREVLGVVGEGGEDGAPVEPESSGSGVPAPGKGA